MAYRDEATAARERLAALETELARRRAAGPTLVRYHRALGDEIRRLEHAITWYTNGEINGFHPVKRRDDLSESRLEPSGVPSLPAAMQALAKVDAGQAISRAAAVTRALMSVDPSLEELRRGVEERRRECQSLRSVVDAYALRHPDHPPPPDFSLSTLEVVGIATGGLAAWVTLVSLLMQLF